MKNANLEFRQNHFSEESLVKEDPGIQLNMRPYSTDLRGLDYINHKSLDKSQEVAIVHIRAYICDRHSRIKKVALVFKCVAGSGSTVESSVASFIHTLKRQRSGRKGSGERGCNLKICRG